MNSAPKPSPTMATLIFIGCPPESTSDAEAQRRRGRHFGFLCASASKFLFRLSFREGEVRAASCPHLFFLHAEFFVPGFKCITAGRQSFNGETAVGAGDRVVRIGQNVHVSAHPG